MAAILQGGGRPALLASLCDAVVLACCMPTRVWLECMPLGSIIVCDLLRSYQPNALWRGRNVSASPAQGWPTDNGTVRKKRHGHATLRSWTLSCLCIASAPRSMSQEIAQIARHSAMGNICISCRFVRPAQLSSRSAQRLRTGSCPRTLTKKKKKKERECSRRHGAPKQAGRPDPRVEILSRHQLLLPTKGLGPAAAWPLPHHGPLVVRLTDVDAGADRRPHRLRGLVGR
jgi:hypothetical protein